MDDSATVKILYTTENLVEEHLFIKVVDGSFRNFSEWKKDLKIFSVWEGGYSGVNNTLIYRS